MKSNSFISLLGLGLIYLLSCSQEPNPSNDDNDSTLKPGVNEIKINQIINGQNVERMIYVKTPNNIETKKLPLVFVFHGAGGSGTQFLNDPTLDSLIESGAFVGVFPNGHRDDEGQGGFWNLGSEPTSADDLEFIDLIFENLSLHSELDLTNAFAIGYSNGAGMVNLIGKKSSHFKAIAPLFSQQITSLQNLTPLRPLSVLQVNGKEDQLIPIEGGQSPVGEFMSAEDSFSNWASYGQCQNNYNSSTILWGNTELESYYYDNCEAGIQIKYLIALDTKHGWNDNLTRATAYRAIWNFFNP